MAFHHPETHGPSLHAGSSSQPRCGRHVFLHGGANCWWNAKGIPPYAAHARPLDVAGGGCGFPAAMASHQDGVLEASRGRGGAVGESAEQGRARNLAAPVLGAHDQERPGLCRPHGLHSFQSGETRTGDGGRGVAVLVVSQIGRDGALSTGVDRQGRCGGWSRRTALRAQADRR